jgi:hypothetical protein
MERADDEVGLVVMEGDDSNEEGDVVPAEWSRSASTSIV